MLSKFELTLIFEIYTFYLHCRTGKFKLSFKNELENQVDVGSYFSAEDYCGKLNSNLVSIHSEAEKRLIASSEIGYSWIGLKWNPDAKNFSWVDNTTVDFQAWQDGEPNEVDLTEDSCFYQNKEGFWGVADCEDPNISSAICKKSPGIETTTIPITTAKFESTVASTRSLTTERFESTVASTRSLTTQKLATTKFFSTAEASPDVTKNSFVTSPMSTEENRLTTSVSKEFTTATTKPVLSTKG